MVHISVIFMHWTHKPDEIIEIASIVSDESELLAMQSIKSRYTFPSRTLICPILGTLMCIFLMCFTSKWTIVRFIVWNFAIGQPIYWLYGRKHSILGNKLQTNDETIDPTNDCENNLPQQQYRGDDTATTTITFF